MSREGSVLSKIKSAPAGFAPLFHEPWWLEAAAAAELRQVQVHWGDQEVASLFFTQKRRFGLTSLSILPYTRTLGPRLTLPQGGFAQRLKHVERVTQELIAKLPQFDRFYQIFDPEDETAFCFSLAGFTVETGYTFRIPSGTSVADVLSRMNAHRRKSIREAEKYLTPVFHADMDRFEKLARAEYSEGVNQYDFPTIRRIFEAARLRGQATIVAAVNGAGADQCHAVLVWDARTLYFWLATRDHEHASRGAKSFVAWQAIQFALEKGLTFDFDGYASPAGAHFILSFGFPPTPRPIVIGMSRRGRFASALASLRA